MSNLPNPKELDSLVLKTGSHSSPRSGLCVMEAVAYFRGLEHTDSPPCVSPSIGGFLRILNDALNDEDRQKLKPYVFRVVGTATTASDELRRSWLATDWLVRMFAAAWLDVAGLSMHAGQLRALPELTNNELTAAAQPIIDEARRGASAAWSATGSAARSTAWSAAESAAESAARLAAWSAAESAARSAARSAAESAARSAARSAAESAARLAAWSAVESAAESAAWSAAESALADTVTTLQHEAFNLLDRMIAVGRVESN